MKKLALVGGSIALSAAPLVAFAQSGNLGNLTGLITSVGHIFNLLIPILIVMAILAFFWGLIGYIRGGKGLSAGRDIMLAGLISLFIMISLWGIVAFIGDSLGIRSAGGSLSAPSVSGVI